MGELSAEETWMLEAKETASRVLGELDDRLMAALEVGMVLGIQGHREGLVELV